MVKVYEVVEDYDECEVTLYRTLDKKKADSIVEQINEYANVKTKEFELEAFTFGEKMYAIDYSNINVYDRATGKRYYGKEINYKPVCTMGDIMDYRTESAKEVIPSPD